MRKQDRLIALINTLTQGERKFFVQSNRTAGSSKSYFKLYELLLKKKEYNADELCRVLKKDKAHLANEKRYLEKNLLKSLRIYHEKNSQLSILNKMAEGILLMEKNLPDLAAASLRQCIEFARVAEQHPFTFHAHGLMLTLCSDPFTAFSEGDKEGSLHLEKMKRAATQIQLTADFEILNAEVFTAYSKRKKDITDTHRRETQKLLKRKLLKADYENVDFMFYKYNLQALLYSRLGDNSANIDVNKKCLELYEKQTVIDVFGYWNALANLTQSLIAGGNKKLYQNWMAKLETRYYNRLPVDGAQITKLLNAHKSVFTSGAYFALVQKNEITTQEVRLFTKQFIKRFAQEKKVINASHFAAAVFKTAACSFTIGDVADCIDLLNRLFNDTDQSSSPATYKNAKLLFVLAHAEWNKMVLFPGLVPGVTAYLKKHDQYGLAEEAILKHFHLLSNPMNRQERSLWFTAFKEIVESLSQKTETRMAIEMLPLDIWLRASGRFRSPYIH